MKFHRRNSRIFISPAPNGVAHAHDLVHLLARAISIAGVTDRAAVRDALENLDFHPGMVHDYAPPFTAHRHDALDRSDYRMARYVDGVIMPVEKSGGNPAPKSPHQ